MTHDLSHIDDLGPEVADLSPLGVGPQSLEATVRQTLRRPAPVGWRPSGIGRSFYLDLMERIVRQAVTWVDADGRVIDPALQKEAGQGSPRLASSGAVLMHFGRAMDLRDTLLCNMAYCCRALASGQARGNSPDFWMRELATAYMALQGVVDAATLRRLAADLSAVEPEAIYTCVRPDGVGLDKLHNWAVYASAGEMMRQAAGLEPAGSFLWGQAFFDRYVGAQLGHFTVNGMYRDPGDPITYDITTRLQIACGLTFGYRGRHRRVLEELLRRGGLTTLLFMSPEGFCPFGGRSDALHFREAIVTALCELEARRYAKSDAWLAGAFKRQARLAAASMGRWLAMQPWRFAKNGFDPQTRHGCDAYGNISSYGQLIASFLGLAAIFADESIAEAPAPAEVGGFVFELAPAFHKVFANCSGSYVEIDTQADPHYDATGLGRFIAAGVPPELALAMPLPVAMTKWGGPATTMAAGCRQPDQPQAIGPSWQQAGQWVSLAGLGEGLTHRLVVRSQAEGNVDFAVIYAHGQATVSEDYRLTAGSLDIHCRVAVDGAPVPAVRFIVPLLVSDGNDRSETSLPSAGAVVVNYRGHAYTVSFDEGIEASIETAQCANRNGIYRMLVLSAEGGEVSLRLALR